MKHLLFILLFLGLSISYAQVGIGTIDPKATLDITASNKVTPSNEDGILIPRIDAFPLTNPGADQNSMIVYLTTTNGTDNPGFYYWDNATTDWLPFGAGEKGWDVVGNSGTTSGTNFLGTTDNEALDIRTNNVIKARFTTKGQLEILNTGLSTFIGEGAGASDDLTNNRNTFVGYEAGNDVTIGYNSVALGYRALNSVTTGYSNVAIGLASLDRDVDPENTVAIGTSTLGNAINDTEDNVVIGISAMANSQSSVRNVAVGYRAGVNVDGPNNVFIGSDADNFNSGVTAARNVVVGSNAGMSTFGTSQEYEGRVLLGYAAGQNLGQDNTLYIENSNSNTPLIYGEFDNDILRIGGQLQIGSSDDTATGSIYAFPVVDGTNGQVLTTDGAGAVTWENSAGSDTQDLSIDNATADLSLVDGGTVEIKTIADSDDDTLIQVEENADEDIIRFDVSGTEHFTMNNNGKLEILNSGNSIYIGDNAGLADPTTVDKESVAIGSFSAENLATGATSSFHGKYTTAIGFNALNALTIGNRNTSIGHNSSALLTTGRYNLALGANALARSTDSDGNVALGTNALEYINGDNNVAVGYRALYGIQNPGIIGNARYNTALGDRAGLRVRDGQENVWVGRYSDQFNNNGNGNTIIGTDAGASVGSARDLSGRVLIGFRAGRSTGGVDNTLYIENSESTTPLIGGDFSTDRVGINIDLNGSTANLTHTLTVGGNVFASGGFQSTTNNYPDYVFENYFKKTAVINTNYTFTPLNEAITFVKENGHLPNVKSLQEIKDNNMTIDLGETSIKNLEKIEENFIYISELKTEIDTLKSDNERLEEKIDELIKLIKSTK